MLKGNAERPVCHFELPSIYDENGKRVLEFECLGINSSCVRKFYLINPTSLGYQYIWKPLLTETNENSEKCQFKCLKLRSWVLPGKKSEIAFEFKPKLKKERKIDEYWRFEIPSQNIQEVFHFVGTVLEPKIFFNNARVNFGSLLLEGKGKDQVILKNFDNIPYSFSFSKHSIKGPDVKHNGCLSVKPLSGIVSPNSQTLIQLEFVPRHETIYNYNLQCSIQQRAEPLGLNIKGTGYKLHHILSLNDKKKLHSKEPILVDFGEVFVKENKNQVLTIFNTGDFNFDFIIKKKENLNGIFITPETTTGDQIFSSFFIFKKGFIFTYGNIK